MKYSFCSLLADWLAGSLSLLNSRFYYNVSRQERRRGREEEKETEEEEEEQRGGKST